MKIGSYVPVNGLVKAMVNRPCHSIVFRVFSAYNPYQDLDTRIRVDLQNNMLGSIESVIPSVSLGSLVELFSYGEGFCYGNKHADLTYDMYMPVRLSPRGNLDLTADKFLDIEISNMPISVEKVEVYCLEDITYSALSIKYNKLNIPRGIDRQVFVNDDSSVLILPTDGFDELMVTYRGGLVSRPSLDELRFLTAIGNDLTSSVRTSGGLFSEVTFGFTHAIHFDLLGVERVEVIRDQYGSSSDFELLMVSYPADVLTDRTKNKLIGGSVGGSLTRDGRVFVRGAEQVRDVVAIGGDIVV